MKLKHRFWRHFNFTLAFTTPLLLTIPVYFSTINNPNKQAIEQQNPESWFDLNWKPTQPSIIQIPENLTNQSFQSVVEQMMANQQLTIGWQFDLVSPYQLLKQYQNDYDQLSKAFSFNYFNPETKQWTSDHNWKFAITNVDRFNQDQIDLTFEIYQYDQNHFATGQIATIKKSFSLQNQLADPATYYQAVLKSIQLVPNHNVSNISFATLLQNIHFPSDFQAWWMLPPIIGANLKLTLGTQLIKDQIIYDMTINDQYHLNNQVYQLEHLYQPLNYGFINGIDFSKTKQLLQQWQNQLNHLNYLNFINDQTIDHLIFNQDWSNYNVRNIDLQGFTKLTFQTSFSFPSYDYQNNLSFTGDLKLAKALTKLSVPGQYQTANNVNQIYLSNLPQASSYQQLENWTNYFRQTNNYEINQFDPKWINQVFANANLYDQSQQLLNLEAINQWKNRFEQQQQIPSSLIKDLLKQWLKTNVKNLNGFILPVGGSFDIGYNLKIEELMEWTKTTWKEIKTIKFTSQWLNESNPQNKVYEQIDLTGWSELFKNVSEVGFETLTINPEIIVINYPSFAKSRFGYSTTPLNNLPFQIKRILNPEIIKLAQNKTTLDLDQNLPFQLINPIEKYQTIADYGASGIFNSFDLETNKNLYNQIENLQLSFNYPGYLEGDMNLWTDFVLRKQFGFLFNQPDWLLSDWNPNNASDQSIKSDRIRHIKVKTNDQEAANLIFQNLNGFRRTSYDLNPNAIAIANLNFQLDQISGLGNQEQIQQIINNGKLDFQAYQNQFDPKQFNTSLINFQSQIKAIDLTNVTTINPYALAGLKFTNLITINLSQITNIGEFAFAASNLNFNAPQQWNQLQTIGNFAFSGLTTGFEKLDLSQNQSLNVIPTGAFANTKIDHLQIPSHLETIETNAFINANINATKQDHPLNLSTIINIQPFAFANNLNLNYVQTGQNYKTFSGFENSGLITFDFRYIETIDTTNLSDQGLVLTKFSDQSLNLINVKQFAGHFNLPSVNKIILNRQLNFHSPISGFTNLKTLVNYNALVDPSTIFGPTKYFEYQLIDPSTYQPKASDIGYDSNTGILDWRFWNPLLEADDFNPNKAFNQVIHLTSKFFATNPIKQINKLILPNQFNLPSGWWEKFAFNNFYQMQLPPIEMLTIEESNNHLSANLNWLNPWLIRQDFNHLDPNFFLKYGSQNVPKALFRNVQFRDQDQIINLKPVKYINEYAFWNSNLKNFIGLEKVGDGYRPDMNNYQIDDYAFNSNVNITIASQYQWSKRSFGIDQDQDLPENIKIYNYQNPNDLTWGGYYDPFNKVLDLRDLPPFATISEQLQFLKPIQDVLKNTIINVLLLPQWNAIHAMWLKNWLFVNKLVIAPQTTILGYLSNSYDEIGINVTTKARFKTIPPLAFTNIVEDHTNFWKD